MLAGEDVGRNFVVACVLHAATVHRTFAAIGVKGNVDFHGFNEEVIDDEEGGVQGTRSAGAADDHVAVRITIGRCEGDGGCAGLTASRGSGQALAGDLLAAAVEGADKVHVVAGRGVVEGDGVLHARRKRNGCRGGSEDRGFGAVFIDFQRVATVDDIAFQLIGFIAIDKIGRFFRDVCVVAAAADIHERAVTFGDVLEVFVIVGAFRQLGLTRIHPDARVIEDDRRGAFRNVQREGFGFACRGEADFNAGHARIRVVGHAGFPLAGFVAVVDRCFHDGLGHVAHAEGDRTGVRSGGADLRPDGSGVGCARGEANDFVGDRCGFGSDTHDTVPALVKDHADILGHAGLPGIKGMGVKARIGDVAAAGFNRTKVTGEGFGGGFVLVNDVRGAGGEAAQIHLTVGHREGFVHKNSSGVGELVDLYGFHVTPAHRQGPHGGAGGTGLGVPVVDLLFGDRAPGDEDLAGRAGNVDLVARDGVVHDGNQVAVRRVNLCGGAIHNGTGTGHAGNYIAVVIDRRAKGDFVGFPTVDREVLHVLGGDVLVVEHTDAFLNAGAVLPGRDTGLHGTAQHVADIGARDREHVFGVVVDVTEDLAAVAAGRIVEVGAPVGPNDVLFHRTGEFRGVHPAKALQDVGDLLGGPVGTIIDVDIDPSQVRGVLLEHLKASVKLTGDEVFGLVEVEGLVNPAPAAGVRITGFVAPVEVHRRAEERVQNVLADVDVNADLHVVFQAFFDQCVEVFDAALADTDVVAHVGVRVVMAFRLVTLFEDHLAETIGVVVELLAIVQASEEGVLREAVEVEADIGEVVTDVFAAIGHRRVLTIEVRDVLPVGLAAAVGVQGNEHTEIHGSRRREIGFGVREVYAVLRAAIDPRAVVDLELFRDDVVLVGVIIADEFNHRAGGGLGAVVDETDGHVGVGVEVRDEADGVGD